MPSGGEPADASRLRAHLAETLPESMIPAAVVALAELPLTTGGKVDRSALPEPAEPGAGARRGGAPRTPIERAIVETWQAVLGLPEVGLDDNFFDLGGHSLLLVETQQRLQSELGVSLPMTTFFRYPTVQALAEHLAGTGSAGTASGAGQERALAREASRQLERERRLASRRRPERPGRPGEPG